MVVGSDGSQLDQNGPLNFCRLRNGCVLRNGYVLRNGDFLPPGRGGPPTLKLVDRPHIEAAARPVQNPRTRNPRSGGKRAGGSPTGVLERVGTGCRSRGEPFLSGLQTSRPSTNWGQRRVCLGSDQAGGVTVNLPIRSGCTTLAPKRQVQRSATESLLK